MTTLKVRIDQWLWSVRIFKSRSKATAACKSGKVRLDDRPLKPSFHLKGGEHLHVIKNGFHLQFEVRTLLRKRVSYTIAQSAYIDHTPQEERNKYKDCFVGKAGAEFRARGAGRPSKKERRELESFKMEYLDWDDF